MIEPVMHCVSVCVCVCVCVRVCVCVCVIKIKTSNCFVRLDFMPFMLLVYELCSINFCGDYIAIFASARTRPILVGRDTPLWGGEGSMNAVAMFCLLAVNCACPTTPRQFVSVYGIITLKIIYNNYNHIAELD